MKNTFNFFLFIALSLYQSYVYAQVDSLDKPSLKISGSIDAYYKNNLNNAQTITSFTKLNSSFAVGMLAVKAEYNVKNITAVADLALGNRAKEFSYNDEGIMQCVKQLYLSYNFTPYFSVTAGSWVTHIGNEYVDAALNKNYSMSYMFSFGPFSHTGVKCSYSKNGYVAMLGLANSTDYKNQPEQASHKKNILAQLGYQNNSFSGYLNYLHSEAPDTSSFNQLDAVVNKNVSNKLSLGFNATVGFVKKYNFIKMAKDDAKIWQAIALYANYSLKSNFLVCYRAEYIKDEAGIKFGAIASLLNSILANTLSVNLKYKNLCLIPELRYDVAGNNLIFTDIKGQGYKSLPSVLVAVVLNL